MLHQPIQPPKMERAVKELPDVFKRIPDMDTDNKAVAAGICIAQGVVAHIAVPIERLGIAETLHQGIGTDESSQLGIIVAGFAVIEAGAVELLACVLVRHIHGRGGEASSRPSRCVSLSRTIRQRRTFHTGHNISWPCGVYGVGFAVFDVWG